MLTSGSGAVKAELIGANMVMLRSGLFSADACPKPCMHAWDWVRDTVECTWSI